MSFEGGDVVLEQDDSGLVAKPAGCRLKARAVRISDRKELVFSASLDRWRTMQFRRLLHLWLYKLNGAPRWVKPKGYGRGEKPEVQMPPEVMDAWRTVDRAIVALQSRGFPPSIIRPLLLHLANGNGFETFRVDLETLKLFAEDALGECVKQHERLMAQREHLEMRRQQRWKEREAS